MSQPLNHNTESTSATVRTVFAKPRNVDFIKMLFDGMFECFVMARAHIEANNESEKTRAMDRAKHMVLCLQGGLDFDRGGELVYRLDEFYGFLIEQINQAQIHNDLEALTEIMGLVSDIRESWENQSNTVSSNSSLSMAVN